ncbi:integrase [Pseudomonas asuensis]|uniref:Integrase n=1 Tax=Pseudomonas asuensis TaxID=1825787 RepID=A0ABQ2GWA7_9PSED|nr:DNA-binding protein [Pseudomonas asuensis]GGM16833.1 integrase [Pseudomonas asuensis]
MSRTGIDKDMVASAIRQLKEEGKSASVPEIRALTGGSFTTIQRYKKELEADSRSLSGPGGRIRADILGLVEQLEKKLLERAQLEIGEAEQKLAAQAKTVNEKLQLADERASAQQERIKDLEARLAKAETLGEEYASKYNAANNELARQAVDLTHSQRESTARAQRIEALSTELKTARDALEGYQEVMQRQRLQDQVQSDSAVNDLRHQHQKVLSENESLRQQNIHLIRDNERLQAQQTAHIRQLDELARQLEQERATGKDLIRQIARLEARLETLQS